MQKELYVSIKLILSASFFILLHILIYKWNGTVSYIQVIMIFGSRKLVRLNEWSLHDFFVF